MTKDGTTIIVGAGLAGLTAALELLDTGERIVLVDRDSPEAVGGLARLSFGGLFFANTPLQARHKITDSADAAFADWCRFGELTEGAEDALPRAWAQAYCADSAGLYHWLTGLGQKFMPVPLWVERDGNTVPRWHVCWGTGDGLVRTILRALEAHPGRDRLTIRYGIRVDGLSTSGGAVTGITGEDEATGTPVALDAARVVIATGGINGVDALIREHWHKDWQPAPPVILTGAHQYGDGTMHRAAAGAGAQVHRLDRNWNYAGGIHHWNPTKPNHGLSTVPARSALWVNGQGARIMPPMVSGFDTRDLFTQLCRQPAGYGWQVMNRKIALKELAVSGAEMNPAVRDHKMLSFAAQILFGNRWLYDTLTQNCVDVVVADDLPSLVNKMNALSVGGVEMREDTLRAALSAWDAEIAKGNGSSDPQMQALTTLRQWKADKLRLTRGVKVLDPKAGPLVAIRTFPIARKSLGGIVTDLASRVLTPQGDAIPGLYAVGEAAGFGGGNMNGIRGLEGTFLGGALYTARRLGAAAREGA
ncbi:MAG: FAD-binding dehydrogenase [Rhodobacterales bacterium]|nr:MAG: FAD-binding dehydrogenase [Rhodobacterales bacterium]